MQCLYIQTPNCLFLPCQACFFIFSWDGLHIISIQCFVSSLLKKIWFVLRGDDWINNFFVDTVVILCLYKKQAVLLGNLGSVVRRFKVAKLLLMLVVTVRCLENAFQSVLPFYTILGIQKAIDTWNFGWKCKHSANLARCSTWDM